MIQGRKGWYLAGALAVLVSLFSACFDSLAGGGDATETGNALAGTMVLPNGNAAVGARIQVVPADFNPVVDGTLPESLQTVANARGQYRIRALAPGRYNVQAMHPTTGYQLLVTGIELKSNSSAAHSREKDMMKAPGSLKLRRPDWVRGEAGHFFVPGSTVQSPLSPLADGDGYYLFDSLPSGVLPEVRFMADNEDSLSYSIAQNVTVTEELTHTVPALVVWKYAARLGLNTASDGLTLAGAVTDFPLLVRLTRANFSFSEARADGQDLRFEKNDGSTLPFEIETWSDTSASVWVKLDTLHAGQANQALIMRWGNAQATLPNAMPPVFDTAAQLAGVWHLNETAADTLTQGLYRDATPGGSHLHDRNASAGVPGIIGQAQVFAKGDYIQGDTVSQVMKLPNGYTLSVWFQADVLPTALGGEMLSIGDHFGLRLSTLGNLHTFYWPVVPPTTGTEPWYAVETQGKNYADGAWHLVQATFDGETLKLFADGEEVASRSVPGTVDYRFNLNATLGRHGNGKTGFDYVGKLDEAQLHRTPRSLDWHRAAFANQKPDSPFPHILMEPREPRP